jgi:hypothetical protein
MATWKRMVQLIVVTSQFWIKTVMPSNHNLEPKFGWGHEEALSNQKEAIAVQIEQLEIDPSWRPNEVVRYIARLIRSL